jgi:hypothetical protein
MPRRRKVPKSTIHWLLSAKAVKTFCGLFAHLNTTDKEKVTCRNCKRLMRQHDHLPEEQP